MPHILFHVKLFDITIDDLHKFLCNTNTVSLSEIHDNKKNSLQIYILCKPYYFPKLPIIVNISNNYTDSFFTSCSSSSPSAAVFPDTARSASQSEQMRSMVHILHPHPFQLPESPFRNRQINAW